MTRLRITSVALALGCLGGVAAGAPPPALLPGRPADIQAAVRKPGARMVLVNIWATWCLPCREEMPALLRLRRTYADRGLRLVLVSGDFSSEAGQAAAFLHDLGVDFPTYIKDGSDMAFIDAFDPKWSGALPATFIYDGAGRLQQSMFGPATYEQFEEQIRTVMRSSAERPETNDRRPTTDDRGESP
jgi:thiol-disulfide isomerase/thioredoxin